MDREKLTFQISNADQVGIVVKDLDGTMEQFKLLLGIDDFEVVDWPKPGVDPELTYYGKPAEYKMRVAFTRLGNVQVELIEPGEGINVYGDFLKTHGPGLHHIRFSEKDFDQKYEQLQKAGIQMIASGKGMRSGATWAVFDTTKYLGIFIELRRVE